MKRSVKNALSTVAAAGLVVGGLSLFTVTGQAAAAPSAQSSKTNSTSCQLGNGVKHVIEIAFDNVHFNRDNPNVPSDVEQLPALQNFIESNGTLLSNDHTPLIAHTADDTITNYTSLYGDRQGLGITNSYGLYKSNGTVTDPSAFSYWTANYNIDGYPNMAYSATVPAAGSPPATPPAPWVPFTKAGCNVGDVSTSNQELENTNPDLANVFGSTSPEVNQLKADTDPYKDQETNDYVGLAVHCAQGASFCANATAVKFGQTAPSATAAPDVLPSEPGGYTGYTALYGSKYLTPVLDGAATTAAGTRVVHGNTYPVDNGGALTDLGGNTMYGQYAHTPGFPGFSYITAAQSLAYVADMQETGVPVTYAYIADLHEVFPGQSGCGSPADAAGPGDICYEESAQAYNTAFANFFQRLKDDGITPANTEFVFTADEGDHFAGANVGRATTPTCTGTAGVALDTATGGQTPYTCSYSSSQIGEVATDIHGLLSTQTGDSSTFYSEPQGDAVYATGTSNTATNIRQMERDFGALTMVDPYDGTAAEPVAKWIVDPTAEQLLHFVDADPNRTPSFTVWPNPDAYFTKGSSDSCGTTPVGAPPAVLCNPTNDQYSWNHGYFAPEIDTTWLGLVGPGVKNLGLDGPNPSHGPNSSGNASNGTTTVADTSRNGTWVDQTDVRPTLLALVGLKDDYIDDGRVITQVVSLPAVQHNPLLTVLGSCYKQLNGSVGQFGTDVIVADTAAIKTGTSTSDTTYQSFETVLGQLGTFRDQLAGAIKQQLFNTEFNGAPLPPQAGAEVFGCGLLIAVADHLAGDGGAAGSTAVSGLLAKVPGALKDARVS